jgi:hypothetical protein
MLFYNRLEFNGKQQSRRRAVTIFLQAAVQR